MRTEGVQSICGRNFDRFARVLLTGHTSGERTNRGVGVTADCEVISVPTCIWGTHKSQGRCDC